MSEEIVQGYRAGYNLYSVVRKRDGTVWYPTGKVFEAWGTGGRDADDYDIALTYKAVAMYVGDLDTNIPAGRYLIQTYLRAGANPADTDNMVGIIEQVWNGWESEVSGEVGAAITVAQAKTHLRITHSDDDTYIEALTLVATEWCEEFQRRVYVQREVIDKFDEFPTVIRPRRSPLISVDSLKYIDTDGVLQTVDPADYEVGTYKEPGRITPAYNVSWPSIRAVINAVTLTYQAGYVNRASIPTEMKHAVKLMVGHLYENREAVGPVSMKEIPLAAKSLLWPKRLL